MARRRTTFGKLQRDRDKQAKQRAKVERRQERNDPTSTDDDETVTPPEPADQGAVLDALAKLHAAYDDGQISLEDFEVRRDELRDSLHID